MANEENLQYGEKIFGLNQVAVVCQVLVTFLRDPVDQRIPK